MFETITMALGGFCLGVAGTRYALKRNWEMALLCVSLWCILVNIK
jgi:hypothetical protein